MKSKKKIEKQMKRKGSLELVETIIAAKKNKKWNGIADVLSSPRKNKIIVNLDRINRETKDGELVVIPGKVLSHGDINKKIKLVALNFSEEAREKLLNAKCELISILSEIKKNPEAKGIKVIK